MPMHYSEKVLKDNCISIHNEMKRRRLLQREWPTTDAIFYSEYLDRLCKMAAMIPEEKRKERTAFLDVGCGEGRLALLLSALGFNVKGVDAYCFEGANTHGESRGPLLSDYFKDKGIDIKKGDIEKEKLPFPDGSFEVVTFMEVIEHLHNSPKPVLREIYRVLKKDGVLLLSTPNCSSLKKRVNSMLGRSNHWPLEGFYNFKFTIPPNRKYIGHTREYTMDEVETMLRWEGFCVISAETYDLPKEEGPALKGLPEYWMSRKGTGIASMAARVLKNINKSLKNHIFIVAKKV